MGESIEILIREFGESRTNHDKLTGILRIVTIHVITALGGPTRAS